MMRLARDILANLRVAGRNLGRNRRRASIALLIVAVGVISMVLAEGFVQWIFWAMREGTIQSQLGHIQVVRPGYFKAGAADPFAYLLPSRLAQRQAIEATPGVKLVAPRLSVTGLVSHGDTTVSFLADGVDPAKEADLSKAFRIVAGRNLSAANAQEVVLGRGLARSLDVKPGATVALLASPSTGGVNAVEATVAGIFITGSQAYDDSALRLPIGLGNTLLRSEGAHAWLVLLDDTEHTDARLAAFRQRFAQGGGLEFVPWYERADFYNKTVSLFSKQMLVLRLIIACIIVLSISNMLVMNVLERTGEIGTLLAIGFKRRKIMQQFAAEGLMLGLVGGLLGVTLGFGLAELISFVGIPMPPPPGMEEGYRGEVRVSGDLLLSAFGIAFLTTLLAGLYPAWKASRMEIVNALRHNI
jgi:putative ABC transport system permease protein